MSLPLHQLLHPKTLRLNQRTSNLIEAITPHSFILTPLTPRPPPLVSPALAYHPNTPHCPVIHLRLLLRRRSTGTYTRGRSAPLALGLARQEVLGINMSHTRVMGWWGVRRLNKNFGGQVFSAQISILTVCVA
jgi:hypothetical protein